MNLIEALLDVGVAVSVHNRKSRNRCTVVEEVAQRGHVDVIRLFLAAGAKEVGGSITEVYRQSVYNDALIASASCGHAKVVQILIEAGADVNASRALTLHRAISHNHIDTVAVLLTAGAHVNIGNMDESAPLHRAAQNAT